MPRQALPFGRVLGHILRLWPKSARSSRATSSSFSQMTLTAVLRKCFVFFPDPWLRVLLPVPPSFLTLAPTPPPLPSPACVNDACRYRRRCRCWTWLLAGLLSCSFARPFSFGGNLSLPSPYSATILPALLLRLLLPRTLPSTPMPPPAAPVAAPVCWTHAHTHAHTPTKKKN